MENAHGVGPFQILLIGSTVQEISGEFHHDAFAGGAHRRTQRQTDIHRIAALGMLVAESSIEGLTDRELLSRRERRRIGPVGLMGGGGIAQHGLRLIAIAPAWGGRFERDHRRFRAGGRHYPYRQRWPGFHVLDAFAADFHLDRTVIIVDDGQRRGVRGPAITDADLGRQFADRQRFHFDRRAGGFRWPVGEYPGAGSILIFVKILGQRRSRAQRQDERQRRQAGDSSAPPRWQRAPSVAARH